MKIPKTRLSKMQMEAISEIINQCFLKAIQQSDYRDIFSLPPDEWSKEATKFWETLDEVTNQSVSKIESLLHLQINKSNEKPFKKFN